MAMLAIGCAKEQVGSEKPDGQEINVTFKASLPDGIQTRAIGDGTTANTLIVAVYDEAGNELSSIRKTEPSTSAPQSSSASSRERPITSYSGLRPVGTRTATRTTHSPT